MNWTAQQRAMLEEMGLRVWAPHPNAAARGPAAHDEGDDVGDGAGLPNLTEVRASRQPPVVVQPAGRQLQPQPQPQPHQPQPARLEPRPVPVQVVGLQHMDWSALQTSVAQCTACKLCTGRSQAVLGVGSLQAQWLVVGDAPIAQDEGHVELFAGKSGQLLDNMLSALGCTRHETFSDGRRADAAHQVYLATAVKCRPPAQRNPETAELAQCEPYLARQVELLRPRIILAMGRFAIQSLLGSTEPMGRLRGRVHRYQGVAVVVTYPPAYLLRSPQDKAKAWDDLCLALRVVDNPSAF